jgi:hypothetical protein
MTAAIGQPLLATLSIRRCDVSRIDSGISYGPGYARQRTVHLLPNNAQSWMRRYRSHGVNLVARVYTERKA